MRWPAPHGPQNGISVSSLKVYNDYYLQQELQALKAQLGALGTVDSNTLLSKGGGTHGETMQGSGFTLQGTGPGTAQTTIGDAIPPDGSEARRMQIGLRFAF